MKRDETAHLLKELPASHYAAFAGVLELGDGNLSADEFLNAIAHRILTKQAKHEHATSLRGVLASIASP